jgi:hypothetical protein
VGIPPPLVSSVVGLITTANTFPSHDQPTKTSLMVSGLKYYEKPINILSDERGMMISNHQRTYWAP